MHLVKRLRRLAPALGVVLLAVTACKDSNDSSDDFTVSGTVDNVAGTPIPSNARVVVAWVVSATSPDYTYIFGEGTVTGSTFQITFHDPPPAAALNAGQLGVGIVVLTTSTALQPGVHLEDASVDPSELLGATGQYAIIYKVTEPVAQIDWASAFPLGFGVGVGVERPGDFDAFAPVTPNSLELIVDDLENIDFVNWT